MLSWFFVIFEQIDNVEWLLNEKLTKNKRLKIHYNQNKYNRRSYASTSLYANCQLGRSMSDNYLKMKNTEFNTHTNLMWICVVHMWAVSSEHSCYCCLHLSSNNRTIFELRTWQFDRISSVSSEAKAIRLNRNAIVLNWLLALKSKPILGSKNVNHGYLVRW